VLSILGRDAMWGDIRRFFRQRSDQLAMQEWTPASVREVERSLLEDSSELRGSFLGCLRHVCDMEQAVDRGMTPAESSFLRRLRRKFESRPLFLKGPIAKNAEDLLREAFEAQDWKTLLGICDLARVLGARTGRHPLHQPLVSDAVFWEVLFGLSLQARSWNRLHKHDGARRVRPIDIYVGACIVPSDGGELPSLALMRTAGADGSWMSGSLDRWLHDIIQQPGDSLIPPPGWSTPWSWLRQAADQILASPVGTRNAVVNTIARALQEMGWDADRPKELAAHRLQAMVEEMASKHRLDAPAVATKSARVSPETGLGYETGSFSIFKPEELGGEVALSPIQPLTAERSIFRDEFNGKCEAWAAAKVHGLTPIGLAWWEDFLRLCVADGGERAAWAGKVTSVAQPGLIAGFEDLIRFLYPAPVRPGRLTYRCLDRFPPDPRNEIDRAVLDMLFAACDECLGPTPQPTPLIAVRRWQAQSSARMLPSHSPDWWSWLGREGALRADLVNQGDPKAFPTGVRDTFLAIPQISSEQISRLSALALETGVDPVAADEELRLIIHTIEIAKEQSLRDLLSRF
jgi:hypothetical protein